jgi:hypothetical protein
VAKRQTRHTITILPRSQQIGYAYFENDKLMEAGVKTLQPEPRSQRTQRAVRICVELLDEFGPDLVILPKLGPETRRSRPHVRAVIAATAKEAYRRTDVVTLSRRQVLGGLRINRGGKHAVHDVVRSLYPDVGAAIPARRIWESERYAATRFDAVALYAAWRQMAESEQSA